MMPLWFGSRCWITTNAIPLLRGTLVKNCSNASNPPADAPIPTIGNWTAEVSGTVSSIVSCKTLITPGDFVSFFIKTL